MKTEADTLYEALKARDTRFDGLFFVAVSTTGIYCRPVCAVRLPRRERCSFYPSAAQAEAAGYRPCLRCRPELAPGAAATDAVRRVSDRAVARIEAGALADGGLPGLAAEFGLSTRQLRRVIEQEYGVTPIALAQTRRLLLAKQMLTDTRLRIADIAFASGFSSVRRFNHLFRTRYRLSPSDLRRDRAHVRSEACITLKLGYRPPLAWIALTAFLVARGAPRSEAMHAERYARSLRINACTGWIAVRPDPRRDLLQVEVAPTLLPVLAPLRTRLRQLFDMDANPGVIDAHLGADPRLAASMAATPGLRVPGALDGFELALRAVLGQQISVKAATTLFSRFTEFFGEALETPFPGLNRLPPTATAIADAGLQPIIERGLTRKRAETVQRLAQAVASGALTLAPTADRDDTLAVLAAIPGIGPWTTQYIAMRALADPDAFPASDLALLKALSVKRGAALDARAEQWRPWRAYAAMHLWHHMAQGG
jgi:AraC family transcriptional regulator of adaptative response / DNA-3-methyladenine glycosylase II